MIVSPTYAEIIPAGAEIWGAGSREAAALAIALETMAPSNDDLSAELLREVRRQTTGVEIMLMRRSRQYVEVGGDRYTRSKLYARTMFDGETFALPSAVDHVRDECLAVARLMGKTIAAEITAWQATHTTPVALRVITDPLVRLSDTWIRCTADDVMVRFRAIYCITPVGEETDDMEVSL